MEQNKQFIPVRIQRSRKYKQLSPNMLEIKYVGRPTKWGNPFKPGQGKIKTVSEAVSAYRRYIQANESLFREAHSELKGKNLSCWCPLDYECHADVLLEMVKESV
jgi:hypothetical protein